MKHSKPVTGIRPVYPNRSWVYLLCLLILVFTSAPVAAEPGARPEWLPALLEKESITIVITDSGLGGLSVVADAAEKFSQHAAFKRVNLVFSILK